MSLLAFAVQEYIQLIEELYYHNWTVLAVSITQTYCNCTILHTMEGGISYSPNIYHHLRTSTHSIHKGWDGILSEVPERVYRCGICTLAETFTCEQLHMLQHELCWMSPCNDQLLLLNTRHQPIAVLAYSLVTTACGVAGWGKEKDEAGRQEEEKNGMGGAQKQKEVLKIKGKNIDK